MKWLVTVRSALMRIWGSTRVRAVVLWKQYRGLKRPWQIAIAIVLALLLIGLFLLLTGGKQAEAVNNFRTVTLESVGALSGNGDSVSVIGNVRSVSEADVLAQSGGTVRAVHTRIGASVPAGFVIAELENASERAVVLQAQGAYEAALAARSITLLQAGNTVVSLGEAELNARDAYRSAYTTLDNALENYIDPLMTGADRIEGIGGDLSAKRTELAGEMRMWRYALDTATTEKPELLLERAEATTRNAAEFLNLFARAANSSDSGATVTQRAGVATARASADSLLSTLSTERSSLRAAQTAANVAGQQTNTTSTQTASADASVKQALGSLRLAQASLEKTVVRAPISGTVNFLPVRVGDYVTAFTHVATVANNGSLEIITYVSEADRELISAGEEVTVEATYKGIVTAIAPALDPLTKRIEVRIAVSGETELVNGQSVRIGFANVTSTVEKPVGPLFLPLASVKLRSDDRIVFTVDESNKLVAVPVEIGEVRGDRIEIRSPLPLDVRIVTDARGLAEGQQVNVAE